MPKTLSSKKYPRITRKIENIDRIFTRIERKRKLRYRALTHLGLENDIAHNGSTKSTYNTDYERTLPGYTIIHATLQRLKLQLVGKKVLHLGSSTGIYTRYLQAQGVKAVGLDIHQGYARAARAIGNKLSVRADAARFPFASNSFSCIISDHFLLSDYPELKSPPLPLIPGLPISKESVVLQQAHRTLKRGGFLIIDRSYFRSTDTLDKEIRDTIQRLHFKIQIFPNPQPVMRYTWVLQKR